MPILVITLCALGLVFAVISQKKKDKGGDWVFFFSKGTEAGFSIKEVEMLRNLAIQCNLEDPAVIFSSQQQFDKCIYSLVRGIKMSGLSADDGTQIFLSKLYNYRSKIEAIKPSGASAISNSRQISEGQNLKVLLAGTGVFKSQVVKNSSHYMTISRPSSSNGPASINWAGSKIAIYFWREDDAGYVFDSEVQDEVFSLGVPSLKITHSESLFRTQKRKSVRVKMNKAAFLYLVPNSEPPHQIETEPGLNCLLEDISDTGCAVTVGGKAEAGLRVKVQFSLDNAAICMTGLIRSVSYREETNRTKLHIEAEPLPMEMRNRILGEVFGMLPDEDEDGLPFRVLDEEMESYGAQRDTIAIDDEPFGEIGALTSESGFDDDNPFDFADDKKDD